MFNLAMKDLILPSARMGVTQHLGQWMDKERRNGVELMVLDGMVIQHIWKDGEKFYTVEWPAERAEQAAELFYKGAQKAKRAGGSVPAPVHAKPTVLHR